MPYLDRRKIQTAGNSLSVTLPVGWCRFFGLKAGDEVEIIANGNLIIRRPGCVRPLSVEPENGQQVPT